MAEWKLVPQIGIEQGELAIHFGMCRSSVRDLLREEFPQPQSHFDNEDDFQHSTDGTLIRVRYNESVVQDIELLAGCLSYEGLKLSGGGDWPDVKQGLASLGNDIRETEWLGDGFDCVPLCINIATHEQLGGDGDGIEWVIMSSEFKQ